MSTTRIATTSDLELAFRIRRNVFVQEQGVPLADEFDVFDILNGDCQHILVHYEGEAVGTGRIRQTEDAGKLERICILAPFRKFGLGKVIIAALEDIAREQGITKVKLHGQTQAAGFYEKLGYQAASGVFMEDGIPHILMTKVLSL